MQDMDLFFVFKILDITVHMKWHYIHTQPRQIYAFQLKLAKQLLSHNESINPLVYLISDSYPCLGKFVIQSITWAYM